jgi:hypothetical protein
MWAFLTGWQSLIQIEAVQYGASVTQRPHIRSNSRSSPDIASSQNLSISSVETPARRIALITWSMTRKSSPDASSVTRTSGYFAAIVRSPPCPCVHNVERRKPRLTRNRLTLASVTAHAVLEAVSDFLDQFRKQAEECRKLAALVPLAEDKAFWLRLAEEWEKLAQVADKPV